MYRHGARSILRSTQSSLSPARTIAGRRFLTTEPPHLRSRSWKSAAIRWGIAIAGIYYYNTSPVFAEQPQHNLLNPNLDALEDSTEPSVLDQLTSRRSQQLSKNAQKVHAVADALSSENASTSVSEQANTVIDTPGPGSAAELEEEAAGEGAFNPETGEINWDCPCLGGMAHGPCGPEFREAFSCFVYSMEEPKGMDCIEKFQGMRDCFQKYPEVYKDELEDDDELDEGLETERQELAKEIAERKKAQQVDASQHRLLEESGPPPAVKPTKSSKSAKGESKPSTSSASNATLDAEKEAINEGQKSVTVRKPTAPAVRDEKVPDEELVTKAAHDARSANDAVSSQTKA